LAEGDYQDATGPEGPMRDNALLLMIEQGQALPTETLPPVVQAEIDRRQLYRALEANDPQLAEGLTHPATAFFGEGWLALVGEVPTLAAALAVHAAATRGDVSEAVTGFQALESPPVFVVRAMQALLLHRPTDPTLTALLLDAPPEAPPAWRLHRAARALARRDYPAAAEALATTNEAIRPEVERLATAQRIADAFPASGLQAERLLPLVGMLDGIGLALGESPRAALESITQGPAQMRHTLAILFWRELKADALDTTTAERAWGHWLACELPAKVIDHLLEWHRQAIVDCLSSGVPEAARKHWDMLHRLPALAERLVGFRDALATHFLVHTREVMRHAEAPAGFSADYERGLSLLRRMLSLDRDNIRLLVALIEICNDWFLDCYNAEEFGTLRDLVQRHRPFAEQLLRLIGDRPGEITARQVLSDFWKARGFSESDREKRVAYYREALRLNPNNENVQQLLAEMEGQTDDNA
jgi:tetratricopeptide (TPR) repeat protein